MYLYMGMCMYLYISPYIQEIWKNINQNVNSATFIVCQLYFNKAA